MKEDTGDQFEELESRAYELLFNRGLRAESVLAELNHEAINETYVEMAIESAFSLRHEEALRGELDWAAWIGAVTRDPGRSGLGVKILTAVTIPVTLIAVIWTLGMFPPGRYPRLLLMIPGITIGVVFFIVASYPVYDALSKNKTS